MSATRVQSKTYVTNDWLNSFNFSFTSSITAGSLLIFGVATGASSTSVTSVTDSSGQTWSRAVSPAQTSLDGVVVDVWYLANANSGTHTVTVNLDDYYQSAVVAREYGGIATSTPLDITKAAADGDYEVSHLTGTSAGSTSQANTLSVVFSGGYEDGGTYTAGSGFSNAQYTASSGVMSIGMADRDDSSTGTKSGSMTTTNYIRNANVLTVFKEASVASTQGMMLMF